MSTYGYNRVSTLAQALDGDSLEAQERRIRGYCDQEGRPLTRMFTDRGVSGGMRLCDRPEGAALLAAIRPGDVVVASKLDRAFRNAADALASLDQLKAKRVRLVLLDIGDVTSDTGIGSLLFGVLASVSQWERTRIKERIFEAKAVQKAAGRFIGGKPPFGFRVGDGGRLDPIAEEQAAITLILKQAAEGTATRKISAAVFVAFGLKLSHVAVARIVRDAKVQRSVSSTSAA